VFIGVKGVWFGGGEVEGGSKVISIGALLLPLVFLLYKSLDFSLPVISPAVLHQIGCGNLRWTPMS